MRILGGLGISATVVLLLSLLAPVSRSVASSTVAVPTTAALQRIVLEPKEIRLAHPGATQRLVVTGYYADGTEHDVSQLCRYVSSSAEVLTVSPEGVAEALSSGECGIEARLGDARSDIRVGVADQPAELSIDFSQDLLSIFTQKSCNSPPCHGAIAGKNGFKLSLFGYDPEADYRMIVSAHDGRRVNLQDPEKA